MKRQSRVVRRRVMKVMYSRGWTMAIKRSSTKRHKFTTEVLRARQASSKIYPRQPQPKLRPVAGVCNVTKKKTLMEYRSNQHRNPPPQVKQ